MSSGKPRKPMMERRFKFVPRLVNVENLEFLPQAPNTLPFFKNYKAHKRITSGSSLEPNTVYFFCDYSGALTEINRLTTVDLSARIREKYGTSLPHSNRTFFDSQFSLRHNPSAPVSAIELRLEGHHAGWYIPETNTLLATDWTHSGDTMLTTGHPYFRTVLEEALELKLVTSDSGEPQKANVPIGCDPEFELELDGRIINATGTVRTDSYKEGGIGVDGAGLQVELRPRASTDIDELCDNIKFLINKFSDLYGASLLATGATFPLGGHIHFGGQPVDPQFTTLLDDTIGKIFLATSGRARGSYRRLGSVEAVKSHGGFEYRTPPASIFVDPVICHLTLTIAKRLADRFYSGEEIVYSCGTRGVTLTTLAKLVDIPVKTLKSISAFKKAWKLGYKLTTLESNWCGIKPKMIKFIYSDSIRTDIKEKLSEKLSGILEKMSDGKTRVTIRFFGLRSERGEGSIAGFIADGFKNNVNIRVPILNYGLPYKFRHNREFFNSTCDAIVAGIVVNVIAAFPAGTFKTRAEGEKPISSVI